jgi:hypothetical protein
MKVVAVIALALALMGCTITPEAIIGLLAGAGVGVVAASMVVWPTVLAIFVYYLSA